MTPITGIAYRLSLCFRTPAILVAVAVLAFSPGQARSESNTLKLFKFAAGVISAYGLHETGHALAAKMTNTDLEWKVGTYNQPLGFTENADSDLDGTLINAAGLTTQIICSEVILQDDSIDPNDSFVRGMMFWNIFNPVIYALDYWIVGRTNKTEGDYYQGDLAGVEHYSGEAFANVFTASVAALAIYQGYRFLKRQDWMPDSSAAGPDNTSLNLVPADGGGLMLRFEIRFD